MPPLDNRAASPGRGSARIRAVALLTCSGLVALAAACGEGPRAPVLGSTDGVETRSANVEVGDSLIEAEVAEVPRGFFLGPNGGLWLGRLFVDREYGASGYKPVALLTHAFWEELGGDPAIVGAHLVVDDVERTVVGVTSPGFAVPRSVEMWIPR